MSLLTQTLASLGFGASGLEGRLLAYADLLRFYNKRLNLIARTDTDHIVEHHIVHCLSLAKRRFPTGSHVVDWGAGGGLPLIPLALTFPETPFIGVDAVEKKVQAVRQMARALEMDNVEACHGRAEAFAEPHTHSVSRATAPLETLWSWHAGNAQPAVHAAHEWPAGLICLKGGDLNEEIAAVEANHVQVRIEPVEIPHPYYHDKYIVTVRGGVCAE